MCVCICIQTGDFNNKGAIVPGWGRVPVFILGTKPMRTSVKKFVQWENNERSAIKVVYTRVCVCGGGGGGGVYKISQNVLHGFG